MTNSHAGTTHDSDAAKFLRTAAKIVGATFLLVGILGFVPGITSDYDSMKFAGHESEAKLLGIFQVSILHNIVHLLFGIAGLAMSKNARSAATFLIGGGAIYLLLFLYGLFVADDHNAGNFVPLNSADNILHLLLGIGMLALGLLGKKKLDSEHGHSGIGSQAPR